MRLIVFRDPPRNQAVISEARRMKLGMISTVRRVILCEAKLQRSPESLRGEARLSISDQLLGHPSEVEMFESLASCFVFRCSASLNMTGTAVKQKLQANFQSCIDSTRCGFILVAPGTFIHTPICH